MSASLVGSEMCIRDSIRALHALKTEAQHRTSPNAPFQRGARQATQGMVHGHTYRIASHHVMRIVVRIADWHSQHCMSLRERQTLPCHPAH
eukprot:4091966-Alexandrium_andersonii.AAC.1